MTSSTATDWSMLFESMAVDLPETEHEGLRIERFEVNRDDPVHNFLNFRLSHRRAAPGVYTRLMSGRTLWMSDTTAERSDHMPALLRIATTEARRVVVNGLGLGMIVKGALALPHVEHIDVVEANPRIAALVGPHYEASGRVTVHVADAYAQMKRWPSGTRWDVGWSDIWPDLCADYLPGMARLNRSYARRCDWHACWGQSEIRAHARRYGW